MVKGKALLFGLNYAHCKEGQLNGCINDVNEIAKYIENKVEIPVEKYTDDIDIKSTSYDGIIQKLYALAIESYRDNLEFVWIHYSGHGSYQKDVSGDEKDGKDEGLVPSDYEKKGILIDDVINRVFSLFNPKTKILFICDSCHSGSMLDLKYAWNEKRQSTIENSKCNVKAKTILISGCMDNQTSADAWNLLGDFKSIGALTACILKVLKRSAQQVYDIFVFVNSVRSELRRGGFSQYPMLTSNFDITLEPSMVPTVRQNTVGRVLSTNQTDKQRNNAAHAAAPKLYQSIHSSYIPNPSYYESPNTYSYSIYNQQNLQKQFIPQYPVYYHNVVYVPTQQGIYYM
jgi:hypothetical protein